MPDHDDLAALRARHPAWRLLAANNAPLVLAALGSVFIDDNVRVLPLARLVRQVDDVLYAINSGHDEPLYPRSAQEYVTEWASLDAGWLRTFYPAGEPEPHADATPALEQAVAFVESLTERSFVGTESRLHTVVELLRQLAFGTETDPQARLEELHRRRAALEAQIARVEAGTFDVLSETEQRDRYQQFVATSRELLADFRQVEANFRALDRSLRERIATWSGPKGELLEALVGDRAGIAESDQGRSFQAFFDFLLSRARQEEFTDLLAQAHALAAVDADTRMRHIHHDWLDAGERTQATVRLLSEQLRRFLDDRVWLENRRVVELLRGIESHALAVREERRPAVTMESDAFAARFALPFERPLYEVREAARLDSTHVSEADTDVDASALYAQHFVDTARLAATVRERMRGRPRVGLPEVLAADPPRQGLAELVAYLALTEPDIDVVIDDEARHQVRIEDEEGLRTVTLPGVTFVRVSGEAPRA